jgi:hypothetical protein
MVTGGAFRQHVAADVKPNYAGGELGAVAKASPASTDRLGWVWQSTEFPRADETEDAWTLRMVGEFAAMNPRLPAVRVTFDAQHVLASDNSNVSPWGAKYVRGVLRAAKALNLKAYIGLPEPKAGATLNQNLVAHRFVMDETVRIFGDPKQAAWICRNEPAKWAAGEFDRETYDLGCLDVRYWDESKYHAKGWPLIGASFAGWFFNENQSLEQFYNLKFIWDRFPQNRLSFLQRTGQGYSLYVLPTDNAPGAARLKNDGIVGLFRTHFTSHPLYCLELGMRLDIYPQSFDDFTVGLRVGQMAKAVAGNKDVSFVGLYDWNGSNPLSFKGKKSRQDGLIAGLR